MEQIAFIVSMGSFGLAVIIFVGNIFSKGISEALTLNKTSTKVALACFFIYVISFVGFLVLSNGQI